jgi:hypothetical protein
MFDKIDDNSELMLVMAEQIGLLVFFYSNTNHSIVHMHWHKGIFAIIIKALGNDSQQ